MGNCFSDPTDTDAWSRLEGKKQPLGLKGDVCLAKVVSVYDGDTCTVNMTTKFGEHEWKIRMLGYDSPELKPRRNDIPDEKERAIHQSHGKACKKLLENLILEKFILVQCAGYGKFGRLLGTLWVPLKGKQEENKVPQIRNSISKDVASFESKPQDFINLNDWMVANTPSLAYDGGHKNKDDFDFKRKYPPFYMELIE